MLGAIAGAAIVNGIGSGVGRAATTGIGMVTARHDDSTALPRRDLIRESYRRV